MSKLVAEVNASKCVGCGACEATCPVSAIKIEAGIAKVSEPKCVGCSSCESTCPVEAICMKDK